MPLLISLYLIYKDDIPALGTITLAVSVDNRVNLTQHANYDTMTASLQEAVHRNVCGQKADQEKSFE